MFDIGLCSRPILSIDIITMAYTLAHTCLYPSLECTNIAIVFRELNLPSIAILTIYIKLDVIYMRLFFFNHSNNDCYSYSKTQSTLKMHFKTVYLNLFYV